MINRKSLASISSVEERWFTLDHQFRVAEYNQLGNQTDPFANLRIAKIIKNFGLTMFLAMLCFLLWSVLAYWHQEIRLSDMLLGCSAFCGLLSVLTSFIKRIFQHRFDDFAARLTYLSILLRTIDVSSMMHYEINHLSERGKSALTITARKVLESDYSEKTFKNFREEIALYKYYGLIDQAESNQAYIDLAKRVVEEEIAKLAKIKAPVNAQSAPTEEPLAVDTNAPEVAISPV